MAKTFIIACLQLDSKLGNVTANIARADEILEENHVQPHDINLLILPELAFTGYNFKSKEEIKPYLEEQGKGLTFQWAQRVAQRLHSFVLVGYPEISSARGETPDSIKADDTPSGLAESAPHEIVAYNSCILVNPNGDILVNYRKTHLFVTDESWAEEGAGFYVGDLDVTPSTIPLGGASEQDQGLTQSPEPSKLKVAIGICMDLNPKQFIAPFRDYEFGNHVLHSQAKLVLMPMAWLRSSFGPPDEPDMQTLQYWVTRLEPLLEGKATAAVDSATANKNVIFVACNRVGTEREATFAGTSAILSIEPNKGIILHGRLGRSNEGLLKVCLDMRI